VATPWALMVRPARYGPEFDEFDESTVEEQRTMGWELLACDSEIPYTPPAEDMEPSQRNCNRAGDTGE
jgi:hypothetical protein